MLEEMGKYEQFKQWLETHKKGVISGTVGLIIFIILLINIGLIQVTYYGLTGNTQKVINVISKDAKDPEKQNKLYVNAGIDYLMKDMSELSLSFLEKHFLSFKEERREEILKSYNTNKTFMKDHKQLLGVVGTLTPLPEVYKTYLKRMEPELFERALLEYFGDNPKLTQNVVTELYQITSAYGRKIPFEKFTFSLYELMSFPHEGDPNSLALKLLGNIEPKAINKHLFEELKTNAISVEELNIWVNSLQKYGVITTEQYAGFTNNYGSIVQLRDRYTQLERQEVDLMNMKDKVDVQTNGITLEKQKYEEEIKLLQKQVQKKKSELGQYNQYQVIKLYVMDYYGDGQYEASIPEKSWFFDTYKPTNEKVVIQVTYTDIASQGAYDFKVYNKGSHNSGVPYFVELSAEDRKKIDQIESEIRGLTTKLGQKTADMAKTDEEINMIRKTENYEEILTGIEDVQKSKEQVVLTLEEHRVNIQNLFGIGQVDLIIKTKK